MINLTSLCRPVLYSRMCGLDQWSECPAVPTTIIYQSGPSSPHSRLHLIKLLDNGLVCPLPMGPTPLGSPVDTLRIHEPDASWSGPPGSHSPKTHTVPHGFRSSLGLGESSYKRHSLIPSKWYIGFHESKGIKKGFQTENKGRHVCPIWRTSSICTVSSRQ